MTTLFCLPSKKGSTQKEMNLLYFSGHFFFPFRVDPFSERGSYTGKQTGSHNSCLGQLL